MLQLFLAASLALQGFHQPEASRPQSGPVPEWVERAELDPAAVVPENEVSGGVYYELFDRQVRFVDGEYASFQEYAWRVLDVQGVEYASDVTIDFDPSYHELTIHSIDVIRDGQVHDRFDPDNVQVLQREEELHVRIYDGQRTALVFLADVRPGDIVRYAYSLEGTNPAFRGHLMDSVTLATSVPLARSRYRLLWSSERELGIYPHGTDVEPRVRDLGDLTEYTWDVRDVQAVRVNERTPRWYDTMPWVQLTTFQSWEELASWEARLLDPPAELGEPLRAKIEELRRAAGTPLARAEAAVRFVQDEIRYLGIELGVGAFKASPPDLVYKRRFGDCKDKTLLLVSVLRELGVDAQPGLVSWGLSRAVADYAPSPRLFDHVIVRIDLPSGPFWVDPTESRVGGGLGGYEPAPFGHSLVVGSPSVGLVPVGNPGRASNTQVTHNLDVGGTEEPMVLEVITRYEGRAATRFRDHYGWSTPRQYSRDCLDYYRRVYDAIEQLEAVTVDDDYDANVMVTSELYRVSDFWKPADGEHRGSFSAPEMASVLPQVEAGEHEHPIAIAHPVRFEQTINVTLAPDWGLSLDPERIENEVFSFSSTEYREDLEDGTLLRWAFVYESKQDYLAPGDASDFVADVDTAEDCLSLELTYRPSFAELLGRTLQRWGSSEE